MFTIPKSIYEAQAIVNQCQFKPMDKSDWEGFQGEEDPNAKICYLEDETENGLVVFEEYDGSQYTFLKWMELDTEFPGEIVEVTWDKAKGTISNY